LVEILQGIQMLWLLVQFGADMTTTFRSANLCLVQVQHVQIPRLLRSFKLAFFNIKQNKKQLKPSKFTSLLNFTTKLKGLATY
jgi:hypothetical protein